MFVDTAMLREFKIFEELNDREVETIAKAAKWEELGPGARLSEAGAPAKNLYLIVEGRLTSTSLARTASPSGRTR